MPILRVRAPGALNGHTDDTDNVRYWPLTPTVRPLKANNGQAPRLFLP